jgi:hypothetical protein
LFSLLLGLAVLANRLQLHMCAYVCRYLPVATPYSQRLAKLFDQLQIKPGGWVGGWVGWLVLLTAGLPSGEHEHV